MAEPLAPPGGVGGITPEWLTDVLCARGLTGHARVLACRAERIGATRAFSGGGVWRLVLSWDRAAPDAPASLVAKCAPTDPALRVRLAEANRREAAFYRGEVAGLPVPLCLGAWGGQGGDSLLLLEDLGAHRALRLVDGCDRQAALAAVRSLARVHARFRGAVPAAMSGGPLWPVFAALWPQFVALHPDLPPALRGLGARMAAGWAPDLSGPQTLVHGDAHVENMLFPDGADAVLLDWQMAGAGAGGADLGYFLAGSLPVGLRRAIEGDLVAAYHAALHAQGVTGHSLGDCWHDYRAGAAGKLALTVAATLLMDNAGAAKAAYRRADLARLAAFCEDHAGLLRP